MVFNELEFHILLGWDRGQGYYLCAYVIYVSLDRLFFDGEFWEDSEQGMDLLGVLQCQSCFEIMQCLLAILTVDGLYWLYIVRLQRVKLTTCKMQ